MINQYKIRDINKNPELHGEVFVKKSDFELAFMQLVDMAIQSGADADKLQEIIGAQGETKN